MSLPQPDETNSKFPLTLVIHGGAGAIKKENTTPEKEKAIHGALTEALNVGYSILERGGTSTEAIIAAIKIMEDSSLFNAGKGSVFTYEGNNELDASIMDGQTLDAGSVAGLTTIKNPIVAAYHVMCRSDHVMLIGHGAEKFAEEQGLDRVDPSYFKDPIRFHQFQKYKNNQEKFGTVGAVALDRNGNISAGTSTGGMNYKRYGRVGDTPIIGAGTYAKNSTCGVSATGWGEYFIRLAVAHDISAMMEYGGLSLNEAAESVVMKKIPALGGFGGVVALDRLGNVSMVFNTDGMYRGYIRNFGEAKTFLFKD